MLSFYINKETKEYVSQDIIFNNGNGDIVTFFDFLGDYSKKMPIEKFYETYERVDEKTDIYLNLLDKYENEQMTVAVEELSELQKEICKALRHKINKDNITEEIADVEIMLEQVKLYYNIDKNAVESQKQAKIKRTVERCLKDD